MHYMRQISRYIRIFSGIALVLGATTMARAETITVSAAASLTDAFKEIGAGFERGHKGVKVEFNFGASGALAAQIQQGAPVDVFASASELDMDRLAKANLLDIKSRKDFTKNGLAVIVPATGKAKIKGLKDLAGNAFTRIAIGNPDTVPAGRYAKQSFEKSGVLASIQSKLVLAGDVRQARAYVQRGEADAGVVFTSDSRAAGITEAYAIPDKLHDAIAYPAAVIKDTRESKTAGAFVAYLTSRKAKAVLKKYGFRQ